MPGPAVALVVDDDASFRQAVAEILRRRGWTVVEAASGAEADAEIERTSFALFVVEGALPDIDGVRWLEQLVERGRSAGSKKVFASSPWRDAVTVRHLTRELGVELVLFKPVDASTLASQLDALLAPRKAPGPRDPSLDRAREAMLDLHAEYLRELPAKVSNLERAVQRVRLEAPTDVASDVFREARSKAHRLCGTAGSYGFASVGEAAGEIEDALPRLLDPLDPTRESAWADIDRALDSLRREAGGCRA